MGEKRVKNKLAETEKIKNFVVSELEKRPEISMDLLCFLKNRTALDCLIDDVIASGKADYFSLIVFDLDHFKSLNASIGHDGADLILKMIGRVLRRLEKMKEREWKTESAKFEERGFNYYKEPCYYRRSWSFRNGGDEFAVMVEENSPFTLSSLFVDKMRSELNKGYEALKE